MISPALAPGTLRERKKQRVREEIYNAALGLLAEQPYDKVSVDDICARAQVGKVLVLNREWTKARADLIAGSCKSGKYGSSCDALSIPL